MNRKLLTFLLMCFMIQNCGNQSVTHQKNIVHALENAATATHQNDFQTAVWILQTALKTLPTPLLRDTPTDKMYHKLGAYYHFLGKQQENPTIRFQYADSALTHYEKALEIRQKRFGQHWQTSKTLQNMGVLFNDLHQDEYPFIWMGCFSEYVIT
jgi:hypothetical protein